ncbi:MAG: hypothetical protein FJ035_10710 [Chloroflexi bacterium]|nr:hypothetical protein [Chloroflexota bacterium]
MVRHDERVRAQLGGGRQQARLACRFDVGREQHSAFADPHHQHERAVVRAGAGAAVERRRREHLDARAPHDDAIAGGQRLCTGHARRRVHRADL